MLKEGRKIRFTARTMQVPIASEEKKKESDN